MSRPYAERKKDIKDLEQQKTKQTRTVVPPVIQRKRDEQKREFLKTYHFTPDERTDKDRQTLKDSILLKARKVEIQEASLEGLDRKEVEERMRFALTANRNLQEMFNFSLDGPALKALASQDKEHQYMEYQRISAMLDDMLGASEIKKAKPFYPGFPEEVMQMSEAELFLTQIVYYLGIEFKDNDIYRDMVNAGVFQQVTQNRPKKLEFFERDHKILTLADKDDAHKMMRDMVHGVSMSPEKLELLSKYGSCFPKEFGDLAKGDFHSKENMVNIAVMLYENGMKDKIKENRMCKDATDVLRFISVYSEKHGAANGKMGHDPVRLCGAKSLEVRLPKKEEKAFVKDLLAGCKNLYVDIWKEKDMWKKVMRNIDALYGPERVVKAFNNLAENKRNDEHGHRLTNTDILFSKAKDALREGDITPMENFAKNFQGYFIQHVLNAITVAQTVNGPALDENSSLIDIMGSAESMADKTARLIETLDKVDPAKLLKLKNIAEQRNDQEIRVVRNARGNLIQESREAVKIDPDVISTIGEAVDKRVAENVRGTKVMGSVYIEPALKDVKVPQQQDAKSSDGVSYSTGSRIQSNTGKNLVAMGIHWYAPGNPHIDLDLHTMMYDKDMNFIRDCGWQNHYSREDRASTLFSGDYVTADPLQNGSGAVEFIIMDKENLKKEGAAYVGVYVHDFSGNMDRLPHARAFYMEKEGSLQPEHEHERSGHAFPTFGGEVVDPAEFEESIKIRPRGTHDRILMMYDIEKDNYLWIDEPGSLDSRSLNMEQAVSQASLAIHHAMNSAEPSMYDVLAAYAKENGTITDDITQADTVFTVKPADREALGIKEDAQMLSAYDSDRIYNEFCVKQAPEAEKSLEHEEKEQPEHHRHHSTDLEI